MTEKTLEIFALCNRLAELLGDDEAIADLKILYKRHPKMFENINDVKNTINAVVTNPTVIANANRGENYDVIKALKPLNVEKMGDVIIKNESGTNEIFHANKKKLSEFTRFAKKLKQNLIDGEDAHPSHPNKSQVRANGTSSVRSSTNEIIPQDSPKLTIKRRKR